MSMKVFPSVSTVGLAPKVMAENQRGALPPSLQGIAKTLENISRKYGVDLKGSVQDVRAKMKSALALPESVATKVPEQRQVLGM